VEKALQFASKYVNISSDEKDIIIQAKNSLLFNNNNKAWCKINSDSRFDVTMGSYDGAETCELVGLFLLSELQHEYGNCIGLCRDDGLGAFNESPRNIELIKKGICQIFARHNLKITIDANMKSVDYLDINLNLEKGSLKPYMKPNNTPLYVHNKSNHPPNIIRNIHVPAAINKRLSNISSDENILEQAKVPYQEALRKSGYAYNLKYTPTDENNRRKKRTRNITWYNPPYSSNVKNNIGQQFLGILDESFPNATLSARFSIEIQSKSAIVACLTLGKLLQHTTNRYWHSTGTKTLNPPRNATVDEGMNAH